MNDTYIARAFHAAHTADPNALLFYNEYAIHGPGAKLDYVVMMLRDLLSVGVPVHGIGIQVR